MTLALAQELPLPVVEDFQVNEVGNSNRDSDEFTPAIDADESGNFVVVWYDHRNGAPDFDIFVQRYIGNREAVGTNFRVNGDSLRAFGGIPLPDVAIDASGNFTVVWNPRGVGFSIDVYGQRYRNDGGADEMSFRVNDTVGGSNVFPAIAIDGLGNAVVVWGGVGIGAQRYDADGDPLDANFLASKSTAGKAPFRLSTRKLASKGSPSAS